jgi:cobalt transporter subunit CbtA
MLFQRLIWCALGIAVLLGSAESVLQRLQTVPLILAAEVFEEAANEPVPAITTPTSAHDHGAHDHEGHDHGAHAWAPAEGFERTAWTWVANVLHAFSMALLALAAMGLWTWRRGATAPLRLAFAVAASGWLSLHFWPSLGLPAEVPGMEAAALGARQAWWLLAAVCAAGACATLGFGRRRWRFAAAAALLALPFVVGAPQPAGDALAGFSGEAHARMAILADDFTWATTWLSLSFWGLLGAIGAVVHRRWLQPLLVAPTVERRDKLATA